MMIQVQYVLTQQHFVVIFKTHLDTSVENILLEHIG